MARLRPSLRSTETYTETNFLRLQTTGDGDTVGLVTLEHFACNPGCGSSWSCETIVDAEAMTHDDAVFIAQSYAREHGIPVIYECRVGPGFRAG